MERVLTGLAASPGVAAGQAHLVRPLVTAGREAGSPEAEREALAAALSAALGDIAGLAATMSGEAAEILGFQVAMLEDEALSEGAFAAIATGRPAEVAWREALDSEIAGYLASDDAYFRARSADLEDIRDAVLRHLFGVARSSPPPGCVLVAEDLPPSQFLALNWSQGGGIVLGAGSPSSHVAMLARAKAVPMVVGVGPAWASLEGLLAVDGDAGRVVAEPSSRTLSDLSDRAAARDRADAQAHRRRLEPAATRDGVPVQVLVNVAGPDDLADLPPEACDGIGLTRTEFLVEQALEDEERQFALYRDLVRWAAGRPVTIRTLDAGGDKPIPGYTVEGEANPFLGQRGIRLSLRHPRLFAVQLRALCRAAAEGPVRVMLPMVTCQADIDAAAEILEGVLTALEVEAVPHARPQLGVMVEVPALALAVETIRADFLSIGSNDLTQYATAAARDDGGVAAYADPLHPGVLAMIAHVARHGCAGGRPVGLCGDAGGDPRIIPALLRAGLRSLSVAPALVARAKAAIREVDLSDVPEGPP